MTSIDVHNKMDNTTALGFFNQIGQLISANAALQSALSTVWTAYIAAYEAFDEAFAQTRKWAQTADIEALDKERDQALSAFNAALKSMLSSPNAAKQQAARHLMFVREKYTLNPSDEYMKETTAIAQMIQEMEDDVQASQALTATGLIDWFQDLKQKNAAFLAKMNERTAEQAGQQKGIVREKRLLAEATYKNVVRLINAAAIMEMPEGLDWNSPIDRLNAEVEHYRQILARRSATQGDASTEGLKKGSSSSSDEDEKPETDGDSTDGGSDGGEITPVTPVTPETTE